MTISSSETVTADDAVEALCARALALRHADPAAALALAEEAVEAAASPDARRRGLAALGACLAVLPGEVLRAREVLHRALQECAGAGDDALRCEVLCALGDAYAATSEWEAATQHLREAAELSRRLGRGRDEARALRLQGSVRSGTGDFVQALPLLLQALQIHESFGDADPADVDVAGALWERGTLFRQIAIVYSNMDQFQQAVSYYEVALDCFRDHHPLLAARTLYSMGVTTEEMGDPAVAEDCYRRSLELYERHGDAEGCALSRRGLASLLIGRKEYEQAEGLMHEVMARLEDNPVHLGAYADALWGMADIQTGRSRHAEALAYLERALPIFLQAERPAAHLAGLHRRLSRAYRALGRFEEALSHHERFHQLRLEHLEAQANARMSQMMAQFGTERALKDREISRLRNVELEREIAERKEAEAALAWAKAELEEANRELHALTIRDPLTGLFNRRHLDQRLAEAFALARRHAQPLSVMICDVDDFKRVNDTCSHATGDQVLRTIAGIIKQNVRVSDVAARFGGEEFVVLFPAATLEQAAAASRKLRELVAGFPWSTLHPGLAVTISAGVAATDAQENHEKLLIEADARLYEAKRQGKNRVVS
ncbi:MAG TPA: tetratricopeptide repeat-containing diguanylate cyclase [Longimicrobium sp.]|nr:tetratricopeptide repeat-containing diguanylate cyclase [Longimicrobium sp.]